MNTDNSASSTSLLNAVSTETVPSLSSSVVPSFISCVSTPQVNSDNLHATLKINETTDITAAIAIAAVSTTSVDSEPSSVTVIEPSAESTHCDSVVSSVVSHETTISINPQT